MQYNYAVLSSTPGIAYVGILGNPAATITATARNATELIRQLWESYKLAPTSKPGVYWPGEILQRSEAEQRKWFDSHWPRSRLGT